MTSSTGEAWKFVDEVVYSGDAGKSNEHYTKWAENYDTDLDTLQYATDENVTSEVMIHIENKPDTKILDIAAGTGRCGECLKKLGYLGIMDALEINASMLEIAKSKKMYRNHFEFGVYPDIQLPVDNATYDAVIISGAMGTYHIKPGSLEVIMNCLRPGGVAVFNVRATKQNNEYREEFDKVVSKLKASEKLEEIDQKMMTHFDVDYHNSEEKIMTVVYAYRKI